MLRDRDRLFISEARGPILFGCLDRAPAWAFCPMTFTFRSSLGLVSAGRRSTTCRCGPSRTIGPTLCRSPVAGPELDVFEAWFGDLFDELFGPRR